MKKTAPKAKRHRCSWCSELDGVDVRILDAADLVHWFHAICWKKQRLWLAGKSGNEIERLARV